MYSDVFCRVYNEFGWNYFPEAFGEQLLLWMKEKKIAVRSSLDLACGSGVLCEILYAQGIDASGMDLSEGMITVARERDPRIHYEVADMITYCPERQFDLVTCTGDALNHILNVKDIKTIFGNVYKYLNEGGFFIFDILNEKEIPSSEPFDLDFSETVKAQFSVTKDENGIITLKTVVFENGIQSFEERITETVHNIDEICSLLTDTGFRIMRCSDRLLDSSHPGTTCYIIAQKLHT